MLSTMGGLAYRTVASWTLLAVPLYILMGNFASGSGLIEKLVNAAMKWTVRFPASLAVATFAACAFFLARYRSGRMNDC